MTVTTSRCKQETAKYSLCLLGIFAVLVLSACAVPVKYKVQDTSNTLVIDDLRPAMDRSTDANPKKTGFYGMVWGDERFSPDRIKVLQNRLEVEAGNKVDGKVFKLTRLRSVEFQTHPMNVDLMLFGKQRHDASEFGISNPEQYPEWFVCQVEGSIDGVELRGAGLVGFAVFLNPSEAATSTLMTAIDQIIDQINTKTGDLKVTQK